MSLFTFFSSGTEAIEGAMRVARAITGRSGSSASTTTTTAAPAARRASRRRGRRTRLRDAGHATWCRAATPTGARSARPTAATCAAPSSSASRWPRTCRASWPGAVIELVTNGNGATTYRPGYVRRWPTGAGRRRACSSPTRSPPGFGRTGALVRQRPRGRRPRRDGARQGHGQRLPGHRHRRARRARRGAGRVVPEHELRRQPDGLRRGRAR